MSLVIVGSVALDSISTRSGSVSEALGGSAVYASIAASYFESASWRWVDYPQRGIDILKAHNGLDRLETVPGKTFRWSGKYEDGTMPTPCSVIERVPPDSIPPCHLLSKPHCCWATSIPACNCRFSIRWKAMNAWPAIR